MNILIITIYDMNWWDQNLPNKLEAFREWIGGSDAITKIQVAKIIKDKGLGIVLEVGCAEQLFKTTLQQQGVQAEYIGMDIADIFTTDTGAMQGSIEDIPLKASSVDCVYTRHVLEHLPGFQTGLSECIRVASKCVIVTFFNPPQEKEELKMDDGVHTNYYSVKDIEALLKTKKKVSSFDWIPAENHEVTLVINL